jgi:hypothetical protein
VRRPLLKITTIDAILVTLIVNLAFISVGTSPSTPTIYVDPPISWGITGDPVSIDVKVKDVEALSNKTLYAWGFDMSYDSSILELVEETDISDNQLINDTVTVKQPPIASFTINGFNPPFPHFPKGTDLKFNASASTPEGGQLIDPGSYDWNFGDLSAHVKGKVVLHKYKSYSDYLVTLNVTDTEGLWDTEEQIITIAASLSAASDIQELTGDAATGETDTADNVPLGGGSTTSGSLIRDVAVVKVISWPDSVVGALDETAYVNITVQNSPLGYQRESFTVIGYANTTMIGETTGSLDPGETKTYTIPWITSLMTQPGTYNIKGEIPPLPSVAEGSFLKNVGTTWWTAPIVTPPGIIKAADTLYPMTFPGGASGEGTLATVFFEVIAEGKTTLDILDIYDTGLRTFDGSHVWPLSRNLVDGVFTILGDVGGDGQVDVFDLDDLGNAYGSHGPDYNYPGEPPSSNWNPNCDFNKDNKVDNSDLVTLSENYGKSY